MAKRGTYLLGRFFGASVSVWVVFGDLNYKRDILVEGTRTRRNELRVGRIRIEYAYIPPHQCTPLSRLHLRPLLPPRACASLRLPHRHGYDPALLGSRVGVWFELCPAVAQPVKVSLIERRGEKT